MKIITNKLFLILALLFIFLVISSNKSASKIQSKYKKNKNKIRKLKKELRNQKKKTNVLLLEIKQLKLGEQKYSSFLEMRSDPVFKTMTFGFPIPRSTSYTGLAGAVSNNYL